MEKTRKKWIDQARGFSIFLVVYGHNFPITEPYIYTFHVPLFFFIAGFFHVDTFTVDAILRRAKKLLVPYFFWAILLFTFWWLLGRHYGNVNELKMSVLKNFFGIFYAQGGSAYMSWGIPLWFLPCIFVVYLCFGFLKRYFKGFYFYALLFITSTLGLAWGYYTNIHLPWSLDVAMVAIIFYFLGNHLNRFLSNLNGIKLYLFALLFLLLHLLAYWLSENKVDMYRSIYGNPFIFLTGGISGSLFFVMLFKILPYGAILEFLGKNTIIILATHLTAMTFIKAIGIFVLGYHFETMNEWQKLYLAFVQIGLTVPIIVLSNKFLPVLNGKTSKS
ncbi:MAG: acyltransferase family protein [Flavobacteriaceae bacterium]